MKKIYIIIISFLVVWNVILTVNISNIASSTKKPNYVVEEHRVSGFTTDLTKVVDKIGTSVVTVETSNGSGSGVVIEQKNNKIYVVTSYHVIADSDYHLQLVLDNFTVLQATVVGYDVINDVAVISAECNYNVDVMKMGDSAFLKKGEHVLSVGSPLGLEYNGTFSLGIISDTHRNIPNKSDGNSYYIPMIQSDVRLEYGASGGALINMDGELIGLNNGSIDIKEGSSMTFSLPVNELKFICDSIIETGKVERIDLGLKLYPIVLMPNYQKTALSFGLDQVDGMYVSYVSYGSISEKIGVKKGDALLKLNNFELSTYDDLYKAIYSKEALTSLQVLRNGEILTLGVKQ